ncbi:MAG: hypothetical protein QM753_15950 [Thermomicrobiales bacterium]
MARSFQNVGVQFGVEATKGTSVAANKRLLGFMVNPQPAIEKTQFKPSGSRVNTVDQVISEKTEADFEGPIDYNTIVYPLSSMFGKVTPVAQSAPNAAAKDWTWNFTGRGDTNAQTYTVEVGDATSAMKFTYGTFTGAELSISRTDDNTISGAMLGQQLQTGQTLTATPTEIDIVPVAASSWDVYVDTTSAAIGTTKLPSLYEAGLNFSDFFSEEYTVDSTKPSFASLFDAEEPTYESSMMVAADATGLAYITAARNAEKRFIRFVSQGAIIPSASASKYTIQIDMCVGITEIDSIENDDGKYVINVNFGLMYDSTWAKAMSIKVTNGLTTL